MLSLAGGLTALPYIAMVIAAGLLYNMLIENPRLVREAREGYVSQFERTAAEAELAELRRQATVAQAANVAFNEMLKKQASELEAQSEQKEQELVAWEAEIKAKGRSCPLSADDIRRLPK